MCCFFWMCVAGCEADVKSLWRLMPWRLKLTLPWTAMNIQLALLQNLRLWGLAVSSLVIVVSLVATSYNCSWKCPAATSLWLLLVLLRSVVSSCIAAAVDVNTTDWDQLWLLSFLRLLSLVSVLVLLSQPSLMCWDGAAGGVSLQGEDALGWAGDGELWARRKRALDHGPMASNEHGS